MMKPFELRGAEMARILNVAAAQLGPVHRADTRESVVKRLVAMLREAHSAGAKLVVFPELALTTFFPRWWIEDQAEIDAWFEREMPNAAVRPLFETAPSLGIGFYLGYAELTREAGAVKRYNTSILVAADGSIIGRYRKVHLPGHAEHRPDAPFQHLEKRYFNVGNEGFPVWRAFGGNMGMQDVELVMLGYNTPTENVYHYEKAHLRMLHNHLTMQAGAYQNGTWVVATAKCGSEDGHPMICGAGIIGANREISA